MDELMVQTSISTCLRGKTHCFCPLPLFFWWSSGHTCHCILWWYQCWRGQTRKHRRRHRCHRRSIPKLQKSCIFFILQSSLNADICKPFAFWPSRLANNTARRPPFILDLVCATELMMKAWWCRLLLEKKSYPATRQHAKKTEYLHIGQQQRGEQTKSVA